jgi:hypothetical protein
MSPAVCNRSCPAAAKSPKLMGSRAGTPAALATCMLAASIVLLCVLLVASAAYVPPCGVLRK